MNNNSDTGENFFCKLKEECFTCSSAGYEKNNISMKEKIQASLDYLYLNHVGICGVFYKKYVLI